ncbi:MAG: OmpA family protein [Chitinophagales bacterium]|nr:OmpA family protein [Chitinophagales bacterium]
MKIFNSKHAKVGLSFLSLGLLSFPLSSQAEGIQTDKILKNYSVTVHAGATRPFTDVRSYDFINIKRPKADVQYGLGGSVTRMFGGVFGLTADYTFGKLQGTSRPLKAGYQDKTTFLQMGFKDPFYFKTLFHQPSLNLYINFSNMFVGLNRYIRANKEGRPLNERKFSAYGKVGIGMIFFDSKLYNLENDKHPQPYKYMRGFTNKTTEIVVPMALGVKYKINTKFDIGVEGQYNLTNGDKLDALVLDSRKTGRFDKYAYVNANFTYKFGSKETQKEHLEWVNSLESYMTNTDAKLANLYTVKDADNDGVIDELDWEPETEEGAIVDTHGRTVDSDGDGIPDHKDPEPFSSPMLPIKDGVNVRQDGLTPDMINQIKELVSTEVKTQISGWFFSIVFFDLDKSNIRTSEIPELYQVANYMLRFPEVKMNIKGYTDVRASEKYNIGLSERRTDAVINYLVNTYGIARDRFVGSYYGEADNMVKNATKEQQHQLNRRVEITIVN